MMKYRLLFTVFTVAIVAICACTNRKNDEMVRLVKEWRGKEIIFPNDLHSTLYRKDTALSPEHLQYTILSYVDSVGCISCKLRLSSWREFLNQIDSTYSGKVSVLFFFNSKSKTTLLHTLEQNGFDYPVCIDEDDKLNSLNHFPSDIAFQTFLLDKRNKVLAIGNPILNPKVKELYFKVISENNVVQNMEKDIVLTRINIDETSLSLGNFDWQKEQKEVFTLKNIGDKPLIIQDVNTSCGCISVNYSKEPIQPHGEIDLEVVYKADHPEHFSKTITVYCNTKSSPIKLSISGNAE